MKQYFTAAVAQLQERASHLVGLIPRDLGREVDSLIVRCRDRLKSVNERLTRVARIEATSNNHLLALRGLRRAVDDLDLIEAIPIAALLRWNDEDRRLNRLTDHIAREIAYPLSAPVVTCSSQAYYHTYTSLGLILVPLAESRFLLHLPDLYHELGHPLLEVENDPKIKPLQSKCSAALALANRYLAEELQVERSGRTPDAYSAYISTWLRCWEAWIVELFCDLFALYVLGPAFVWSHLHLTILRGDEQPFRVPTLIPTEHPPDAARMAALLEGLKLVQADAAAQSIGDRWSEFVTVLSSQPSPEFRRCFPDSLIVEIAKLALQGTREIGCSIAFPDPSDPIRTLLKEAWRHFWDSPASYVDWEKEATLTLFS